jgi:hypothetical protein
MNSGYSYANEKFTNAIHLMATSPSSLRDRIYGAYFHFHPLQPKELPEDLRTDFEWILQQLTKYDAESDEGKVRASLNKLDDATIQDVADKIAHIYDMLHAYSD